jgi:hypothetical protein
MANWKTQTHLEDHYGDHRQEFPSFSIEAYDSSAQETIAIGTEFSYRDRITGLRRTGYYHRDSARMTVLDTEGYIHSHFRCDEAYVAELPASTYED